MKTIKKLLNIINGISDVITSITVVVLFIKFSKLLGKGKTPSEIIKKLNVWCNGIIKKVSLKISKVLFYYALSFMNIASV